MKPHKRCPQIHESLACPFQNGSGRSGPPPWGQLGFWIETHTLLCTCRHQAGGFGGWGRASRGGFSKYASFSVPTKCRLSQLSEGQFWGPKRPVKLQNKQRIWRQEAGQGAKLVTRDGVGRAPSHPLSTQALGQGERASAPHDPGPQHCREASGSQGPGVRGSGSQERPLGLLE